MEGARISDSEIRGLLVCEPTACVQTALLSLLLLVSLCIIIIIIDIIDIIVMITVPMKPVHRHKSQ